MSIESSQATRRQFHGLQAYRGIAALIIALYHLDGYANATHYSKAFGWIGVDMFFVLSGFIVAYTVQSYLAQRRAPLIFLSRRFIRIYPMYVLMALLALGVAMLTGFRAGLSAMELVKSFTLFPQRIAEQLIPVAWTLNYELLFYLISAALLLLFRRYFFAGTLAWLAALLALQFTPEPAGDGFNWHWFLTSMHQFEFLCGIGACWLAFHTHYAPSRKALHALIALALLSVAGFLLWGYAIVAHPLGAGHVSAFTLRCVLLGIGFAAIIYALALLEARGYLERVPRVLVRLGDISYVLYLLHEMSYTLLGSVWHQAAGSLPREQGAWWFIPIALCITLYVSAQISRHMERPMTRYLKGRLRND